MSYELRREEELRDARYNRLKISAEQVVKSVGAWVDEATLLHTASSGAAEKAEIIAVRDQFIVDLQAKLA